MRVNEQPERTELNKYKLRICYVIRLFINHQFSVFVKKREEKCVYEPKNCWTDFSFVSSSLLAQRLSFWDPNLAQTVRSSFFLRSVLWARECECVYDSVFVPMFVVGTNVTVCWHASHIVFNDHE